MLSALVMTALSAGPALPPEVSVRTHAGPGGEPYRHLLVRPADEKPGETYPLVVFLHGAGERGDDPSVLLKNFFPQMLSEEYRRRFPCFILAPQCPAEQRWGSFDWKTGEDDGELQAPLAGAMGLVDAALKELPIDRDRVYLTGLSMGGFGTWEWAARRPDLWAAAAPVCGGGTAEQATAAAALPLWVAHGAADPLVKVGRGREMVAAAVEAGGNPIYVEYPFIGHDSWTPAYGTPDGLPAWLFRQRKGQGR